MGSVRAVQGRWMDRQRALLETLSQDESTDRSRQQDSLLLVTNTLNGRLEELVGEHIKRASKSNASVVAGLQDRDEKGVLA